MTGEGRGDRDHDARDHRPHDQPGKAERKAASEIAGEDERRDEMQ